jgi:hypothetical protein
MRFEKPKGQRIKRDHFFGIQVEGMLWSFDNRRWFSEQDLYKEMGPEGYITSKDCNSVQAFRRHMKKHIELHGKTCRLVSRFVGHDVYAVARCRFRNKRMGR